MAKAVSVDEKSGLAWAALATAAGFESRPDLDRVLVHALKLVMQQLIVVPFLVRSGQKEALDLLGAGAAHGALVAFDWLMLDPRLAPIRTDPRFVALAQSSKVRFDVARSILTDAAARGELPPYLIEPLRSLEPLDAQLAALR